VEGPRVSAATFQVRRVDNLSELAKDVLIVLRQVTKDLLAEPQVYIPPIVCNRDFRADACDGLMEVGTGSQLQNYDYLNAEGRYAGVRGHVRQVV
jgi:hypothetical protein